MNGSKSESAERPELETQRLWLRPFAMKDADDVQRICGDREIAANTRRIEHPYPAGAAAVWIEQHEGFWQQGRAVVFAICLKDRPGVVGAIGLELDSENHHAELGYWVEDVHRGNGYASEAAESVIRFGLGQLGLHRIFAHHMLRNPGSGRVMIKAGMVREGMLRGHYRKWGVFEDVVVYGVLGSDLASD